MILLWGSLVDSFPSGSKTDPDSDTCIRAYESIYDLSTPEIIE